MDLKFGDRVTCLAKVESDVIRNKSRTFGHLEYALETYVSNHEITRPDWAKAAKQCKGYLLRVLFEREYPAECYYLGWTYRHIGSITPESKSSDPDLYDIGYLTSVAKFRVYVLQPVSKDGRYHKPVIAMPDRIIPCAMCS